MTRTRKKILRAVSRPVHPGRTIYTAILSARMSVGEAANMLGLDRNGLANIIRGKKRLSPTMAYYLSEIFGWERASRWWWMQCKCNMFEAAVKVRDARKAVHGVGKDGVDKDGLAWERSVTQAWEDMEFDDIFEEKLNPLIEPETVVDTMMKEDLEDAGLE